VSISRKAFRWFSKSGKLILPPPHESFATTGIQNLNPLQLKTQLRKGTTSFDIFRSLTEFQSARRFVISETQAWNSEPRLVELNERTQLFSRINDLQSQLHEIRTEAFEPLEELLSKRPDLKDLPLAMGEECHMDPESASTMAEVSSRVGAAVSRFDGFGSRDIAQNDVWRFAIIKNEIEKCSSLQDREQVLKTIDQILQIDHPRLRMQLVETLRQKESPAGIEMLVKRAKYDLVPEIRQAAADALNDYSFESFRGQLLDGLKYPWHVAAQHSAEALVRLDDQDAVPELVEMLKLADPRLPQKVDDDSYLQRELVAVNHMRNCMLCHAPSRTVNDSARGLTPSWDQPIPIGYYQVNKPTGVFVRADIIYLRQDFSVLQPVKNNGPWPKEQRFDYLVQNKKLNKKVAKQAIKAITNEPNLNREAIVYALRELTDQQPADDSYKTWLAIVKKRKARVNQDEAGKLD
ncbi:hypothetical protein N9Y42_05375, partial [Mariniblastus sp.]|nr:hypothetical protein [Mariniblastus sp.]